MPVMENSGFVYHVLCYSMNLLMIEHFQTRRSCFCHRDTINRTMMEIQDKIAWYTRLNDVFLDVMAMRMSARKLDSSALRSAASMS